MHSNNLQKKKKKKIYELYSICLCSDRVLIRDVRLLYNYELSSFCVHTNKGLTCTLWIDFTHKSFTHPHVVSNLFDFLSSLKHEDVCWSLFCTQF